MDFFHWCDRFESLLLQVHAKTDTLGIGVIGRSHLVKDEKNNTRVRFGQIWCDIKTGVTFGVIKNLTNLWCDLKFSTWPGCGILPIFPSFIALLSFLMMGCSFLMTG